MGKIKIGLKKRPGGDYCQAHDRPKMVFVDRENVCLECKAGE